MYVLNIMHIIHRDLPMDYTFCSGAESYASQRSPSPPPQFDMLSENKKAKDSGKRVMLLSVM